MKVLFFKTAKKNIVSKKRNITTINWRSSRQHYLSNWRLLDVQENY